MKLLNYNSKLHRKLFDSYCHSQSLIYSHLDGIFSFELYVDDIDYPMYGILYTDFDYHFVFGEISVESLTQNLIDYIKRKNKSEAILLTPNGKENPSMKELISKFNGVIDKRYFFRLNHNKFNKISKNIIDDNIKISKKKFMNSLEAFYNVSYISNNKELGYSRLIACGNDFGEIDVFTEEPYRNKGIAFNTSVVLINKCLEKKIEPLWTAWKVKQESHQLAYKLGFEKELELSAYIWVQDFLEIK